MIDSTIMRVHQDGSNPRGGQARHAMGRSRVDLSNKIHMAFKAMVSLASIMLYLKT